MNGDYPEVAIPLSRALWLVLCNLCFAFASIQLELALGLGTFRFIGIGIEL